MSSDQFSEKPLPPAKKECPSCGEIMPADATRCWLCLEKFSTQQQPRKSQGGTRFGSIRKESESGAAWIVAGVIGALVAAGLAFVAPGLLLCMLPIAGVVLVIAFFSGLERNAGGVNLSNPSNQLISGLGVLVIVLISLFVALWIICTNIR